MDDKIITSVIIGLISALLTYFFTQKGEEAKQKRELIKEQKCLYFLPFKYKSNEFLFRLLHIEKDLSNMEKQESMFSLLNHKIDKQDLDWFFTDWIDAINNKPGGYFIASTIYMNCILYHKIKIIQEKHPFIEIMLSKNIFEILNNKAQEVEQLNRCFNDLKKDTDDARSLILYEHLKEFNEKTNLYDLITCLRISTIMKNGIPFALHDSFASSITDKKGELMNYEQFCKILRDESQRVKFLPIINFWTALVTNPNEYNKTKLRKVRGLIMTLKLIEMSELV